MFNCICPSVFVRVRAMPMEIRRRHPPSIGVTDSCESWESNWGFLLLTVKFSPNIVILKIPQIEFLI